MNLSRARHHMPLKTRFNHALWCIVGYSESTIKGMTFRQHYNVANLLDYLVSDFGHSQCGIFFYFYDLIDSCFGSVLSFSRLQGSLLSWQPGGVTWWREVTSTTTSTGSKPSSAPRYVRNRASGVVCVYITRSNYLYLVCCNSDLILVSSTATLIHHLGW